MAAEERIKSFHVLHHSISSNGTCDVTVLLWQPLQILPPQRLKLLVHCYRTTCLYPQYLSTVHVIGIEWNPQFISHDRVLYIFTEGEVSLSNLLPSEKIYGNVRIYYEKLPSSPASKS